MNPIDLGSGFTAKKSVDSTKYDIMREPGENQITKFDKKETYILKEKNITLKDRYQLGKLLGNHSVHAAFVALVSSFKSQEKVAKFYAVRLNQMTIEKVGDIFSRRKTQEIEKMEEKVVHAFYPNADSDVEFSTILGAIEKNYLKDVSNFSLLDCKIEVTTRTPFQKVVLLPIRMPPPFVSDIQNRDEPVIVSKDLMALLDDPLMHEGERVRDLFFKTLGYEKQ